MKIFKAPLTSIFCTEKRWAIQFRSKNSLDGYRSHLVRENGQVLLFNTRSQARDFVNKNYGYIKDRNDLKKEPHGWKIPRVVKIVIDYSILS